MPWIDITRNLAVNRARVVDLFSFNDILYAIVKTYDPIVIVGGNVNDVETGTYKIYSHLGADPPVIDTIWGQPLNFRPFAEGLHYVPGGKTTNVIEGFIYIGNNNTGEVYVNTTANVIDANWTVLAGPFGSQSGMDADLRTLYYYNNKLYAGHKGGVSIYNTSSGLWELVGLFLTSPDSFGTVTDIVGFQGELYVTVSYGNVGKVYKYNETVGEIDEWIIVGELPATTLKPSRLIEYNNGLFLIAQDPDKNVFDVSKIETRLTGKRRFLEGVHLKGVPTSVIKFKQDQKLWITCAREEFVRRGYLKGDINLDGKVDWNDVVDLADFMFNGSAVNMLSTAAADTDSSGVLDIGDFTTLVDYLQEGIDTLPGDSPVLIDTIGNNLITSLGVDTEVLENIPVNDFNVGTFRTTADFSSYNPSPPFFPPLVLPSSISDIVFPGNSAIKVVCPFEQGPLHFDWPSIADSDISITSWVVSGPLTNTLSSSSEVITISCDVVMRHPNAGPHPDVNSTWQIYQWGYLKFSLGLADGSVYVNPFGNYFYYPWINNYSGYNLPLPSEVTLPSDQLFSTRLTYTFNVADIVNFPGFPDSIIMRLSVDTSQRGILAQTPGGPADNYIYRAYRAYAEVDNLKIENASIYLDTDYIIEDINFVPDIETTKHKIVTPFGSDKWFLKFSQIYMGDGDSIYPTWHGPYPGAFKGIIARRLVTNAIDLKPNTSYTLNFVVFVPALTGNSINLKVFTPRLTNGTSIVNYQNLEMPKDVFFSQSVEFTTFTSGLTAVKFYLEVWEDIVDVVSGTGLHAPAIYFSDVNITEKITGATANTIYRYNGITWNDTASGEIDPVIDTDIPRTGLTDNWDIRSNAYQLYSHGGGKVWVWHQEGGLYSGSALGIAFDERPQIVNIL